MSSDNVRTLNGSSKAAARGAAAPTSSIEPTPKEVGAAAVRSPFQGERAGVTWILYMDTPGGHCTQRLHIVRGVESWDTLTELSDEEALTAAQAALNERNRVATTPSSDHHAGGRPRAQPRPTAREDIAASSEAISSQCLSSKTGAKLKKQRASKASGTLDDLFAMSSHSSSTRRNMGSTMGNANTALLASMSDADGVEESDSLLAVYEQGSQKSGVASDDRSANVPPRTVSLNTALSEDDTIVGSDRWSVAGGSTTSTVEPIDQHHSNGWQAVHSPASLDATRADSLQIGASSLSRDCAWGDVERVAYDSNLLEEADEYLSSVAATRRASHGKSAAPQKSPDPTSPSKAAVNKSDAARGRPNAIATEEPNDKRKARRSYARRSEEEKAAITSSDEDQKPDDAPRLSHKRSTQKGEERTKASTGKVSATADESPWSPSKRGDKKSDPAQTEKKQTRTKKEKLKNIDVENTAEAVTHCRIDEITGPTAVGILDEEQSIDPLANFSQRRPLQRLLSPPGKVRPKQDQSLIARVNISPRKRPPATGKPSIDLYDLDESDSSSVSEKDRSGARTNNPYLEPPAGSNLQARHRESSSSGELHVGAVPTQDSLDRQNMYSAKSLQIEDLKRVDNSMSTMGAESGCSDPNRRGLLLMERSATSSGDESSESNTSGYSLATGLRYLNPNANLAGLLDAKAKGQFVQLNLEGKEGVQVVDSLHVRSEHTSGLHHRKVVPCCMSTRSVSYDDSMQTVNDADNHRGSVGKMLSDMNAKHFRRSTGSKPSKFTVGENLLGFGARRTKNAENTTNQPSGDSEMDLHDNKKFFGRSSLQKARSERKLLTDDECSGST
jgi:hypothetical protein